jgi:hypothetical protein
MGTGPPLFEIPAACWEEPAAKIIPREKTERTRDKKIFFALILSLLK